MAGPPGWLIGAVAAVGTLAVFGIEFALFTSGIGIAFATLGAFWIGAGAAAVIDPSHAGRNAAIVALAIVASLVLYVGVISSRPSPPGFSTGGPNVLPPSLQRVP